MPSRLNPVARLHAALILMTDPESRHLAVPLTYDSSPRQSVCLDACRSLTQAIRAHQRHHLLPRRPRRVGEPADPYLPPGRRTLVRPDKEWAIRVREGGEGRREPGDAERPVIGYNRPISSSRLTPVARCSAASIASDGSRSPRSYEPYRAR